MRDVAMWRAVQAQLRDGHSVFMACVVDHTRHSPGTRGAKLVLDVQGRQVGTIGGGVMEKRTLERGARALELGVGVPEVEVLHHRKDAQSDTRSGMICAGSQTNVSFVLEPSRDLNGVEAVLDVLSKDTAGTLIFEPESGLYVQQDLGLTRPDVSFTRLVYKREGVWSYQEDLLGFERAVIFGGGHCGLALSRQLDILGFVVTVVDIRRGLATFVKASDCYARHVLCVEDYAKAACQVTHKERTYAIVMTSDFPSDVRALFGALGEPFPYVGVMGSGAKLRAIYLELERLGVPRVDVDRIVAPIGLSIRSSTPEEIAVSVAAQMIATKHTLFPNLAPRVLHG